MSIFDFTLEELEEYLVNNNFKKYNAKQIWDWIYKKNIYDYNLMSNLAKNLVEFLNTTLSIYMPTIETKEIDKDVIKYLLVLEDKTKIECVLMRHNYGDSLCVSSQVGCNMNCAFCESGQLKKIRNLTCGEMVNQILLIQKEENIRIDSVVIMGIGEPFDNYDNIVKFISVLISPFGVTIAQRKITVSTCGLVPKIIEFASLDTQVNLAVSLHASNDEVRNKLMPINKVYPIKEVMNAIDYYIEKTNRRVTIEYILLDNINDSEVDAYNLYRLIKGKLVYVNLIPYNETSQMLFKRSDEFKIKTFYDILSKNKIVVTLRREMGRKSSSACGQLRARKDEEK
ncbi:MAG: 23S rRNA (adenine(2503)-C(2))-methyltransferase RlmN [Bacilli bacterium]